MLHEPMTFVTDILLAAWAAGLGGRLFGQDRHPERRLWAAGLVCTAAAALLGGVWHGFSPSWGEAAVTVIWRLVLLLIGAADTLFGLAVVRYALGDPWRRRLAGGLLVKAGAYLLLIVVYDGFWLAVLDYVPTLLLILGLEFVRLSSAEARWLCAGVVLALIAAGVQVGGLDLHPRFNHNDLYHLLQGGALYLFYRGGRLFAPSPPRVNP